MHVFIFIILSEKEIDNLAPTSHPVFPLPPELWNGFAVVKENVTWDAVYWIWQKMAWSGGSEWEGVKREGADRWSVCEVLIGSRPVTQSIMPTSVALVMSVFATKVGVVFKTYRSEVLDFASWEGWTMGFLKASRIKSAGGLEVFATAALWLCLIWTLL